MHAFFSCAHWTEMNFLSNSLFIISVINEISFKTQCNTVNACINVNSALHSIFEKNYKYDLTSKVFRVLQLRRERNFVSLLIRMTNQKSLTNFVIQFCHVHLNLLSVEPVILSQLADRPNHSKLSTFGETFVNFDRTPPRCSPIHDHPVVDEIGHGSDNLCKAKKSIFQDLVEGLICSLGIWQS